MADPEVEHLGIMAYAAYFRKYKPVKIAQSKPTLSGNFDDVYVRQEVRVTECVIGTVTRTKPSLLVT